MHSLKEKHYLQLARKMQSVSNELAFLQTNMRVMNFQTGHMKQLGGLHTAQFMAASAIADEEPETSEQGESASQTANGTIS
ncbi:hypothetical protein CTheo_6795 [Ceratobasidium theobromae]|uniref:Uncharacterized protein n=1 Tax=Ceratobasidium theobromae TaxID=1582974 RepID=A0A5N5QDA9_9AGAM|nr:hypothetical protein CTheo_6795 [Ceratobasidium theobromae]